MPMRTSRRWTRGLSSGSYSRTSLVAVPCTDTRDAPFPSPTHSPTNRSTADRSTCDRDRRRPGCTSRRSWGTSVRASRGRDALRRARRVCRSSRAFRACRSHRRRRRDDRDTRATSCTSHSPMSSRTADSPMHPPSRRSRQRPCLHALSRRRRCHRVCAPNRR